MVMLSQQDMKRIVAGGNGTPVNPVDPPPPATTILPTTQTDNG